ncbi:MAG TPA: hypothetical protein VGF45_08220 [Polyangia bacterium]
MRRAIVPLTLAAVLTATHLITPPAAHATDVGRGRHVGLGFAVGTPSSLVGKVFLGGPNAFDFGISFLRRGRWCNDRPGPDDCGRFGFVGLFGDYLWRDALARGTAQLDWHIGIGARMWIGDDGYYDDDFWLGARIPIGIDLTFDRPEFLEVFLDIAPIFYVVPTDFEAEAQIGVRLYF